jgi:hypothetical protein
LFPLSPALPLSLRYSSSGCGRKPASHTDAASAASAAATIQFAENRNRFVEPRQLLGHSIAFPA